MTGLDYRGVTPFAAAKAVNRKTIKGLLLNVAAAGRARIRKYKKPHSSH